jgi:CRISPR-associated endonuclease/helicase Cas3
MSLPGFAEFLFAVYGWKPFPWQEELARRVAEDGWPRDLQVPTGLGKTAVLDLAVWALAGEADRLPIERSARTRTFLVVDRRLVVDQAFDRAERLSQRLEKALEDEADDPIGEVARALRKIGEPDRDRGEKVLTVTRMRGGTTWATRWIRRPDLPAVVVGTVDQLGSRALFRGYGVGSRRLPIDAALAGTDALVIVDEVHLARPFVETIEAVHGLESAAPDRVGRPPLLVRMSATLPEAAAPPLVGAADRRHDVAGPRLRASKAARLVTIEPKGAPSVIAALARCHLGSADEPRSDTVAVVVNTVGLARDVFTELRREGLPAVLMIGRVRGADRERIAKKLAPFTIGGSRTEGDPRVVVATQTVEVGVDLDLGAMVVEAAPLDSLVQRLGRLDRQGLRGLTEVTVVRVAHDDPVYGAPAAETWEVLAGLAGGTESLAGPPGSLDALAPPRLDLGTEALDQQLAGVDRKRLVARTESGPVVLPPVLDVWARTAPLPMPDEPVAEYLHGFERPSALVSIAWRAVAAETDGDWESAFRQSLDVVSLRSDEQVEVPLWEAKAFLEGRTVAGADVAAPSPPGIDETPEQPLRTCVRLDDGEVRLCRSRQDIRPGAILLLPSAAGGYDEWGWSGRAGQVVPDVADLCRPGGTLRLDPLVLETLGLTDVDTAPLAKALRARDEARDDDDREEPREAFAAVLAEVLAKARAKGSTVRSDVASLFESLSSRPEPVERGTAAERVRGRILLARADHDRGVVVRWNERGLAEGSSLELRDDADHDDSDRSTSRTGCRVELGEHCRAVGARAAAIARRLGLAPDSARAVELAALAHDLGKGDPRFQLSLWGGDRLGQEADGRLLAKSDQPSRRHGASWPRGMRHEALSATVVGPFLEGVGAGDVDATLVRHLVQAYHGHGRPLMPARQTGEPAPFRVASPDGRGELVCAGIDGQVDWAHPQEFRELCRRYGWWGLALLEAIVRSADICVSEEGA